MPPEYADRSFWEARFTKEQHCEWLGAGEPLLKYVRAHLEALRRSKPDNIPTTLHIGAGTSLMSESILDLYERLGYTDGMAIMNTDFAAEAIAKAKRARESSRTSGLRSMWIKADALSWGDMISLSSKYHDDGGGGPAFDAVVDKSTSDAISCGPDIVLRLDPNNQSRNQHPALIAALKDQNEVVLEPLQLLALHLAAIVRPGGLWAVLSYSANRFPFLKSKTAANNQKPAIDACKWWTIEAVEEVEAPSGQERPGVHSPKVTYNVYVLRRTNILV
jgi:hypothetical protein